MKLLFAVLLYDWVATCNFLFLDDIRTSQLFMTAINTTFSFALFMSEIVERVLQFSTIYITSGDTLDQVGKHRGRDAC